MSANSNQDPIMFTAKDYVPYSFFIQVDSRFVLTV